MQDKDGRNNTDAILSKSSADIVTNTPAFSAGFCDLYSRINKNGKGLTEGDWWVPSAGEFAIMFANISKLNYCLNLIKGSVPLSNDRYWTSTEHSKGFMWYFNPLAGGLISILSASSDAALTRPVSTIIGTV